jgi:hypothetical protein
MQEFIDYNDGPILMEAVVTKGEHVLPMVPAGKALHQFLVHGILSHGFAYVDSLKDKTEKK